MHEQPKVGEHLRSSESTATLDAAKKPAVAAVPTFYLSPREIGTNDNCYFGGSPRSAKSMQVDCPCIYSKAAQFASDEAMAGKSASHQPVLVVGLVDLHH